MKVRVRKSNNRNNYEVVVGSRGWMWGSRGGSSMIVGV